MSLRNGCRRMRCLAILLYLVMACALPSLAEQSAPPPQKEAAVAVLFTNDVHCHYDRDIGYDGLMLYKKELEQRYAGVLLVDAGDAIQGAPLGAISGGEEPICLMNAVGYDVATLGNHEFDFGFDVLDRLQEELNCGYICANFCTADREPVYAPYKIIESGGMRVAFISADTPEIIYDARPLGATATIMWIRYRNYGLEPDRQSALVMMGAILSDTNNLQSNTTTSADREAIKALARLAGISDVDAFYQSMFRASLSYEGMTDEQVFLSNYKEYESGGTKYAIGCVNAFDEADAKDLAERMRRVIPSAAPEMDMAFAQISAFHDDVDFSYIVPSGDAAAEVLEAAFGDRAVFDGTSYVFKPGISRKQVLVPAITEVLEAHPTE